MGGLYLGWGWSFDRFAGRWRGFVFVHGMKGQIHIGISGWSYYDWKGIFYPPEMNSRDWLQFYANSFETTEINSSFYHLPKEKTILNWKEKVPAHFKFCPKISKYLTHNKRLADPEEPLERFFDVFTKIKKYLGQY